MLIRAGNRIIPLTSIAYCEVVRNDEIIIHTLTGNVLVAAGSDAEVIQAMVARIQKPQTGKKAQGVRKEEVEEGR